jgi:SAM-dependent methyltransferase
MEAVQRQQRRTRLASHAHILAKKSAKLGLDQTFRLQASLLRLLGFVDFPVPTYTQMLGIGSHSIRHYYESGINCYLPIAVAALQAKVDVRSAIRILDFGCGAGRQLLHFTRRFPAPRYHACDVNGPAVRFVERHFPEVYALQNAFRPPLPFNDGHFDMIYSVSVFSHLGPDDQRLWLKELARITTPGGSCFLTTEGPTAVAQMAPHELAEHVAVRREALASRGLIFSEYADRQAQKENERVLPFGSKYLGIEGTYGTTAMSPDYILEHWTEFGFAVDAILEGIIDHRQDLVVLRRA